MIFSGEILEQILGNVDPVTLCRWRVVCRAFKDVIDNIIQLNTIWYAQCQNFIPENAWVALYETLYPEDVDADFNNISPHSDVWKSMVILYEGQKRIVARRIFTLKWIPPIRNRSGELITTIAASKNLISFGTTEGLVYMYDFKDLTKELYIGEHTAYIRSIQFLRNKNDLITISSSTENVIKIWDLKDQSLVANRRGSVFCTSFNYIFIIINNMVVIEGPIPQTVFELEVGDFIAIGADRNKIFLYSQLGYYVNLEITDNNIYCNVKSIKQLKMNVLKYYLFKPEILVCIAEFGHIGISVQGREWKVYNIYPFTKALPTAILVYLNLLVIGVDTGDLYLFNVKDFELLDFTKIKFQRTKPHSSAIVDINLFVFEGQIYLLVATSHALSFMKFD